MNRSRRRMLATAGGLLVAVLVLWAILRLAGPLPGERGVLDWQQAHRPWRFADAVFGLLELFGDLGSPIVAVALVLGVTAVVVDVRGWRTAWLVPGAAGVVVLTTALKAILGPTPLWATVPGHGANYPSGHAAFATALFGLLAWLTWHAGQRAAPVLLVALAPAMALAMVLVGAHLPSDVLAGLATGLAWLLALLALASPRIARA